MVSVIRWIQRLFEHPVKMAFFGVSLAFGSLLLQGTLIDLWSLKSEQKRIERRYIETVKANTELNYKISQARNSDKFIGRQAREKLDLLKSDELVFIFENDGDTLTPVASH